MFYLEAQKFDFYLQLLPRLKKIPLSGGAATTITALARRSDGIDPALMAQYLSWNRAGLVYAFEGRIVRVSAVGSVVPSTKLTTLVDRDGLVTRRYDLRPGTVYLLRPDQHVCARWRRASGESVQAALRRALALA